MDQNKKDVTLYDLGRKLIVDGLVPIYNYDLLTVAGSNLWLGEYEAEGDLKTAHSILREAIYHHLMDEAQELLAKKLN